MMMRGIVLATAAATASGHGAVTFPPPRNAIDSDEAPWNTPVPTPVPFEPWCPFPSAEASASDPGRNLTGSNGQACFWFSNGCASGCDACDGSTRGPIPAFTGGGTGPLTPVPGHIDSGTNKPVQQEPICANALNATVCDPSQRTVNRGAECGAPDDFYFYSPWRRPGSAPVIDSCGTAGGRIPGQGTGAYGAQYQNTTHAKQGDLGSELPHYPSGVTWRAGDVVEVAWALQANHGGGYQYRLCPLKSNLTEACFQETPVPFAGDSSLLLGNGTKITLNSTFVSEGTLPAGSTWQMNPIPGYVHITDPKKGGWSCCKRWFDPPCDDPQSLNPPQQLSQGLCSGEWLTKVTTYDQLRIPEHLEPGEYVLGFRWDCEASAQIWQSCADVTITN